MTSNAAQFYGLQEVHKERIPLRPIAFSFGAPAYELAKELWRSLKPVRRGPNQSLTSTHQLLENFKDFTLKEEEAMVPFDITSIDSGLAKNNQRAPTRTLPTQTTANTKNYELLKMCLHTCFKFNVDAYERNRGTPIS